MSKVVVVDGIIAAGKSELLKCLKINLELRGKKVVLVKEPVDLWKSDGMLELFYKDPKRWGYHFQTKAYVDRVKECQVQYDKYEETPDIYLLERSIFSDPLFMEMLHEDNMVTDMEMKHYKDWWKMWSSVMPFMPDIFLWLNPDLDICMQRLAERARNGEEGISREYQERLLNKHRAFFSRNKVQVSRNEYARVYNLRWNGNFRDEEKVKDMVTDEVERLLNWSEPIAIPKKKSS